MVKVLEHYTFIGRVTSLQATPDIISIRMSWHPPSFTRYPGINFIYRVCLKMQENSTDVACFSLSELNMRIPLLEPNTTYVVGINAVIEDTLNGLIEQRTLTTNAIGEISNFKCQQTDKLL